MFATNVALCLLKCQSIAFCNEVLFQGNVTDTCDPEYISSAFATLTTEFTRTYLFDVSFSQIDVVQKERFRDQCACVFQSCLRSKPEFGNIKQRLDVIKKFSDS